jgi:hypothetical protein
MHADLSLDPLGKRQVLAQLIKFDENFTETPVPPIKDARPLLEQLHPPQAGPLGRGQRPGNIELGT